MGRMPSDTHKILGAKIQRLRKQNNLSQEKLALMLSIDRGYIAQIESGKRNPSIGVIEKIAHGFDMSLAQLFEDVDEPYFMQIEGRRLG